MSNTYVSYQWTSCAKPRIPTLLQCLSFKTYSLIPYHVWLVKSYLKPVIKGPYPGLSQLCRIQYSLQIILHYFTKYTNHHTPNSNNIQMDTNPTNKLDIKTELASVVSINKTNCWISSQNYLVHFPMSDTGHTVFSVPCPS